MARSKVFQRTHQLISNRSYYTYDDNIMYILLYF
jgi:hypothetical protein